MHPVPDQPRTGSAALHAPPAGLGVASGGLSVEGFLYGESVAMLRERCRLDQAPLWCTSMIPSPALLDRGGYQREEGLAWLRKALSDEGITSPFLDEFPVLKPAD